MKRSMIFRSSHSGMWKLVAMLVALQFVLANGELHRGGPGGRFLVESDVDGAAAASARRLLNANLCGRGKSPNFNCASILRRAKQPRCCKTGPIQWCKDVGSEDDFHCGACNKRCSFRLDCCGGKCVNKDSDRDNCGRCGKRCRRNQPCQRGHCGYNGKDRDDDND